jgi:hypothetical protein
MFFDKQPDPARVEAWNRTYRDHSRNPDDPTRCAIPACLGRFPCAFRLEATELLIVAGIDLPDPPHPGTCSRGSLRPVARDPQQLRRRLHRMATRNSVPW